MAQTPLPETSFAGANRTRYMNAELETMLDRYFSTIPKAERAVALGDVLHHITDQLVWIGLYHEVSPALIGRRLVNVGPPVLGPTQAYNAHEWDVRLGP
jgi:ABC-type transport system substrate-binding protein